MLKHMALKIIITIFVLFAFSRTYLRLKDGAIDTMQFVFWLVVWALVEVIALWPGVTQKLANFLGIERGMDAIVYFSVVVLFYLIYRAYVKLENLEHDITKIVRDESINEFKKDE